jgi:hypothetical protein
VIPPLVAYRPVLKDYPPWDHQVVLDLAVDLALQRGFCIAFDHYAVWTPQVVQLAAEAHRDALAVVEAKARARTEESAARARSRPVPR